MPAPLPCDIFCSQRGAATTTIRHIMVTSSTLAAPLIIMAASELASIMCMAPLGGKDGKGGPQKPKSPGTKIHSPCRCGSGQKNLKWRPTS